MALAANPSSQDRSLNPMCAPFFALTRSRPSRNGSIDRTSRRARPFRTGVEAFLLATIVLVGTTAHAAERALFAPENVLSEPAANPDWSELFKELGKPSNRYSRFEERRYFAFREKPVVLKGEIRIVPKRGLSLSYSGAKPHVVVIDEAGVLMRDERGRERSAPDDSRARGVTSALSHVLRFDLPALEKNFVVHG